MTISHGILGDPSTWAQAAGNTFHNNGWALKEDVNAFLYSITTNHKLPVSNPTWALRVNGPWFGAAYGYDGSHNDLRIMVNNPSEASCQPGASFTCVVGSAGGGGSAYDPDTMSSLADSELTPQQLCSKDLCGDGGPSVVLYEAWARDP